MKTKGTFIPTELMLLQENIYFIFPLKYDSEKSLKLYI